MKKALYITLISLCSLHLYAKENTKAVKENIRKVTVFQNSAQIESSAKTYIEAGVTEVVFENLANTINNRSIQVSGDGDFTILSVQSQPNYLNVKGKSKEVLALEDSLDRYSYLLELQNIKIYALSEEESLLLSNKTLSTKENVAVDIEDVSELYRTRLPKIREEQFLVSREVKKLTEIVNRYQASIATKMSQQNSSDIIVTVSSAANTNITLNLIYIVNKVGWTPVYDIRSKDIKSDVNIAYKAEVYQNTGVDWKNVKLVLSTGNPTANGVKPTLNPWFLTFYNPMSYNRYDEERKLSADQVRRLPTRSINSVPSSAGVQADQTYAAAPPMVEVSESQLARIFDIAVPYSIESNGKPKAVEVQNYTIKGQYEYITIPKLDPRAYLVANITDWEKFNLLSGRANVFFEGAFIGETYLNTQTTDDTLQISLGSDKGIIVKREKVNEMSSTKTVGSNKKVVITYEISLRNTKNAEITITAEDQLPIPQDNSIEIKMISNDNANYNEDTGKLKWPLKIAAGETKKVRLSYEIKYPKDKIINGI